MAPATKMPSMPRLSTPARSQISAPRTPKISGVAMRKAAAQKLAEPMMSKMTSISDPHLPAVEAHAEFQEETSHQHAKQRERYDEIGEIIGNPRRPAHRIRADENRGDEDGRNDRADRRQAREHRNDNARIAKAR